MLGLLQGLPRTTGYPYPKSKITILDVTGPSVAATLDAGGWTLAQRDLDRLYLLDYGRPDKNPQKNKNGTVDVVSFADRRVEHVDIGRSPIGGLLLEGGGMAVTSEGPAGGSAGELRLFREGKLVATLPVAARPTYVGEEAGTLYVVGAKAVTRVDAAGMQVTATIPLVRGTEPIVGDGDRPSELVVAPDRRRAFIHYPAQDKVAVLDLEHGKAIGAATTGRSGKKILNSMTSVLTYGMTDRIYFYGAGDPPQLQVRPDGRFAYALNLDTSDVTVVDADTAQAVAKVGAGGRELMLLGGPTVVVVGQELNFIDAARNVKLDPLSLPGLRGLLRSPDGAFAVSLAERTVLILDGATGQVRARLTDFVNPIRIAFSRVGAAAGSTTP
jgi:DNA-binding beta-propeller fold protein YncE